LALGFALGFVMSLIEDIRPPPTCLDTEIVKNSPGDQPQESLAIQVAKTVAADNRDQEAVHLLAELTSWGLNLKIVLSAGRTLAVREAPAT
jgi:hypothetical protein